MVHSGLNVGEFGDIHYWDERYRKEEESRGTPGEFDWYPGVEELVIDALAQHCKLGSVLEVGCGSSRLAERLCRLGYGPVLAIDLSQVAVDQAQRRATQLPEVCRPSYEVMDACRLDCPDSSWDVVVDKATLDAIDCMGCTEQAVQEVWRVLQPGGFFMLVSCRDPSYRVPTLEPRFKIEEVREFWPPEDRLAPCPNAFVYCLRGRDL